MVNTQVCTLTNLLDTKEQFTHTHTHAHIRSYNEAVHGEVGVSIVVNINTMTMAHYIYDNCIKDTYCVPEVYLIHGERCTSFIDYLPNASSQRSRSLSNRTHIFGKRPDM